MKTKQLLITCEHAVDFIPEAYQCLFKQNPSVLTTHRAIDFGALDLATDFSQAYQCPLFTATVSRLIVDCNRSLRHSGCFTEFTNHLKDAEKQALIAQYYRPYRQQVESWIQTHIEQHHSIIHVSMHSFTPVLNGNIRNADIGFLYDPSRKTEKQLATQWRQVILDHDKTYRIRMNYPYRGTSDGFTTALRKQYPEDLYIGIELESNQSLTQDPGALHRLSQTLIESYKKISVVL